MAAPEEPAGPHSTQAVAAPPAGVRLPRFCEPLVALQLATQRWPRLAPAQPHEASASQSSRKSGGEEEERSPDAWVLSAPSRTAKTRQVPRLVLMASEAIKAVQEHVDSLQRRALRGVQHWGPDAARALGACLQAAWRDQQRELRSKLPFLGMNGLQGLQDLAGLRPLGGASSLPLARIFPVFAAAAQEVAATPPPPPRSIGMTPEQVARRLEGIPVFTVCNANNEFVLVSDLQGAKSLALFCFREDDAAALLAQVKERDPSLGRGARVAPVSLDKVYLLAAEGIAFRFLPDPAQVQHALKIIQSQTPLTKQVKGEKGEAPAKRFYGVPIFQSENLILRSSNQRFIPAFLSKDDMDLALQHASRQKKRVNPNTRASSFHIQVGSLENTLKELETNTEDSVWGSLVLVPPGSSEAQFQLNKKAQ